jgi:hypothetical protein
VGVRDEHKKGRGKRGGGRRGKEEMRHGGRRERERKDCDWGNGFRVFDVRKGGISCAYVCWWSRWRYTCMHIYISIHLYLYIYIYVMGRTLAGGLCGDAGAVEDVHDLDKLQGEGLDGCGCIYLGRDVCVCV